MTAESEETRLRRHLRSGMAAAGLLVLAGAELLPYWAAAADFAHYPGAWFDDAQTRQSAVAVQQGVASIAVYASNDRFDKVHAFYRQFLYELPPVAGGMQRFCLDPVASPQACRRFVELYDLSGTAGAGTRITVYQLR